jgi:hypothetical protein
MTKITAMTTRKFTLFFNQENDDLAYHKAEGKEEHRKHQEMGQYCTIRDFLRYSVEATVVCEDGLHDYKSNISTPKKQEFENHILIF